MGSGSGALRPRQQHHHQHDQHYQQRYQAGDGKQAMELLADHPDFHLMVSDVSLPMVSGPELARLVERDHPELPVLLMSGRGVPPEHELASVVRDVLEKPFKPAALIDAIARARSDRGD